MKKIILIVLSSLFILTGCNNKNIEEVNNTITNNPHNETWVSEEMSKTLDSIKRVDDKGTFYEMDYTVDYYSKEVTTLVNNALSSIKTGCSAFTTYNTNNEFMLCRNYDYRHNDLEGNYTGLNVILNLAPEGKLKSINAVDAYWLNQKEYFAGTLDDGKTDTSLMILSPYMSVDGMNEAGVAASILALDLKSGEEYTNQNTGKERVNMSILLRYIIDNAHNLEEAVEIAKNYDMFATGQEMHMIVSDSSGNSAVFEWRKYGKDKKQELHVTYTNAVTNFYVGFDDAEDSYRSDGSLREKYNSLTSTYNNYSYGYGHGYHRFNGIVSALERYIQEDENKYSIRNSIMEENQALDILKVASQAPGIENTSFTQFSVIYNLKNLTAKYYVQRDYSKSYEFKIK